MYLSKFIKNSIVAGAVASVFVLSSSTAFADDELVQNGSFEYPSIPAGTFQIYPTIPGWASTGCGIELQNNVAGSPFKGRQHAELDSNCSSSIYQFLKTQTGNSHDDHSSKSHDHGNKTYDLCFAYSPRPGIVDNKIRVKWDGKSILVLDRDGTGLTDTDWNKYCIHNLPATSSSTKLEFSDESISDSFGGYIDAVSVSNDD